MFGLSLEGHGQPSRINFDFYWWQKSTFDREMVGAICSNCKNKLDIGGHGIPKAIVLLLMQIQSENEEKWRKNPTAD